MKFTITIDSDTGRGSLHTKSSAIDDVEVELDVIGGIVKDCIGKLNELHKELDFKDYDISFSYGTDSINENKHTIIEVIDGWH